METSSKSKYRVIALMSGGMDSTYAAYWAYTNPNYEVVAGMFIHYGQKGAGFEWQAAKRIMDQLCLQETIYLDISSIASHLSGSLLPHTQLSADPHAKDSHGNPQTFVPGRNMLHIALALPYIYKLGLNMICGGWNYTDTDYPDCTPEFVDATCKAGAAALGRNIQDGLLYVAPAMMLTKSEVVEQGTVKLGVPWGMTRSCYSGQYQPCGQCDSCLVRARAFALNGMGDPLWSTEDWNEVIVPALYDQGYLEPLGLYYEGDGTPPGEITDATQ